MAGLVRITIDCSALVLIASASHAEAQTASDEATIPAVSKGPVFDLATLPANTGRDAEADMYRTACPVDGDEIVVCAIRNGDLYRLDPALMAVARTQASRERADSRENPVQPRCDSTGDRVCDGGGNIPISRIVFTVGDAVVRAVKGEAWRDAFDHGPPSAYETYRAIRASHGGEVN